MVSANRAPSTDEAERIARLVKQLLIRMLELASVSEKDLEGLAMTLSALLEIAESVEE